MRISRRILPALITAGVVVIAALDYWTGPDIGFSLFYLVPILIAARDLPQAHAVAVAIVAAGGWLVADAGWHGLTMVGAWNGVTRLVIFTGAAVAVSRMRADHDRLASLNEQLQVLFDQEQRVARTDGLTSLGNARLFADEYARSVARWRRSAGPMAVACIDLDNFKTINDTRGHAAGDDVLKQMAAAMTTVLRAGDVAVRLGGDEFAILLHDCPPEAGALIANRVLALLRSLTAEFRDLQLGASIGLACFDVPPAEPEQALRAADRALYQAKARGKNRLELVLS